MAAVRSTEVVELLGRVPVFSTLEKGDLERIAQLAVPRQFEPGEVVFREGDSSDTCYVVRNGRARAVRTHRAGRTITLATFGPGDIFGELALFEDERRSATVEAVQRTSVVGVLGPDMRRLMTEHAEIAARPPACSLKGADVSWSTTRRRSSSMSSELPSATPPRALERSAGGVVVRGSEMVAIVPTRRAADGSKVLALPKGHIDSGETPIE